MEQRDFFISYTGDDEAWAVWIANVLKSNGYTFYAQFSDIKPGDNFLEKMNEFLKNSKNFIAVWSERYPKSRFCMTELQSAFYAWNKKTMDCLLPVRIDTHPLEPLYAGLVYVNLSDMETASETKLMEAVRYAVPCPIVQEKAETLYQLGKNYLYGINGVTKNHTKARSYYEQAAAKGNTEALYSLGKLYYSFGLEEDNAEAQKDYTKARDYWEQAAAKGDMESLCSLGVLYANGLGVVQDFSKALAYYKQAAEKGYASALSALGVCYNCGQGVAQDYAKARDYYEQAAAKGEVFALYGLGGLYAYGWGVNVDYVKALQYYKKAADAGLEDAVERMKELLKEMKRQIAN